MGVTRGPGRSNIPESQELETTANIDVLERIRRKLALYWLAYLNI